MLNNQRDLKHYFYTKKYCPYMLLVVFAVALRIMFYVHLRGFENDEQILLYNTWDDGLTFYRIAKYGYHNLSIFEYRELIIYPLLVRLVSPITGFLYGLLVISFLFSIFCVVFFYHIVKTFYFDIKTSFILSLIFSGVPLVFIKCSIQGSEPIFLTFLLLSFYFIKKDKILLSVLFMSLACLTRISGIFVVIGYSIYLLLRKDKRSLLCIVPLFVLLLHFYYFYLLIGNFFAFFSASETFYPSGFLTYPFHDLILAIQGQYRWLKHTVIGWTIIIIFYTVSIIWTKKFDPLVFFANAPLLILALCLKGWSLHTRYYFILWGAMLPLVPFINNDDRILNFRPRMLQNLAKFCLLISLELTSFRLIFLIQRKILIITYFFIIVLTIQLFYENTTDRKLPWEMYPIFFAISLVIAFLAGPILGYL